MPFFAIVFLFISEAYSAPKDYGFLLDRSYLYSTAYDHKNGDRLVTKVYKTEIAVKPDKIKPKHRAPLMEATRHLFHGKKGIKNWRISKLRLEVDINSPNISERSAYEYVRLADEGPYQGLSQKIANGELPRINQASRTSDNIYRFNNGEESAKDFF